MQSLSVDSHQSVDLTLYHVNDHLKVRELDEGHGKLEEPTSHRSIDGAKHIVRVATKTHTQENKQSHIR